MSETLGIVPADFADPRVAALLTLHATRARAATAKGSAHALEPAALMAPDIALWTVLADDELVAVGALKRLADGTGEVKSMYVAEHARGRGVGGALVRHIVAAAQADGMTRLSLETGSWDYFAPARALYSRYGFTTCAPFGDYVPDRNSVFMTRTL